jgi:hypothetical protein
MPVEAPSQSGAAARRLTDRGAGPAGRDHHYPAGGTTNVVAGPTGEFKALFSLLVAVLPFPTRERLCSMKALVGRVRRPG